MFLFCIIVNIQNFRRQICFSMEFKIEILIYYNDVVASASGGSVATDNGARVLSLRHPVTAAARTLGVKESAGMSGESSVRGAYRGSVRVQSAPGEPAG